MRSINALYNRILKDFSYQFEQGDDFYWSSSKQTIFHPQISRLEDIWSLLHELSHAQLKHMHYTLDIELIHCETSAWEYATQILAPKYDLNIDENFVQDHLDTYREWLHKRSTCPQCGQNGLQTQNTYSCINCRCLWRANDARLCQLRRFRLPSQGQIS